MRVLVLHNYYKHAGGEDAVVRDEVDLLRSHGIDVRLLSANNDQIQDAASQIKAAVDAFYSRNSRRLVEQALREFRPDIVHAHNLFPVFSPSVLYACANANVPVVQTLHNYRTLCANALFFRDGHICEDCLGKEFPLAGVAHACYRDSRLATLTTAAMTSFHRAAGTYRTKVDRYIALTNFARDKFIQGGFLAGKIMVKPNFVSPDPEAGDGGCDYFVFVGRLSPEKGIDVLLQAWNNLGSKISLKIIGSGPLEEMCLSAASNNPAIECLGSKSLGEIYPLLGRASALILPSRVYEGFPKTIVESFAKGTPVIVSNIGSMREIVDHNRTGRHFVSGDPDSLAAQIEWMLSHEAERKSMRANVRAEFETKYTGEINYSLLMDIYRKAMDSKRAVA